MDEKGNMFSPPRLGGITIRNYNHNYIFQLYQWGKNITIDLVWLCDCHNLALEHIPLYTISYGMIS